MESLINFSWPGNVRELQNEIKRLLILTPRKIIRKDDLLEPIRNFEGKRISSSVMKTPSLKKAVEELEREMIINALKTHQNNQRQAAKALGLSRYGLIKKIKRYGIK